MTTGVKQTTVIIVGAGPSGLATAACLHKDIPYIILEREDCIASLFNKKSYNRLHFNVAKKFCQLPHFPYPSNYPTYVALTDFLKYFDDYAAHFKIDPEFCNFVKFAKYNEDRKIWEVEAKAANDDVVWRYEGRFLVVATGEFGDAFIPKVDGLSEFKGEVIHSTEFKSGKGYENKKILVVGAGNSGMEIALDLSNHGARTSIVVRSPVHVIPRWSVGLALGLLKFIPLNWVDSLLVMVSKVLYGDLTKFGLERPNEGPFFLKTRDGKLAIIDVGTIEKIKSGEIQVLPALQSIKGKENEVVFRDGKCYQFDAIIFATGFKRSTHMWLQGGDSLLDEDGIPKPKFPNHWKDGENGLYCAGLGRRGIYGAASDAQNIADHISNLISNWVQDIYGSQILATNGSSTGRSSYENKPSESQLVLRYWFWHILLSKNATKSGLDNRLIEFVRFGFKDFTLGWQGIDSIRQLTLKKILM
uniref:probable indole-3-pyruvate monooxygenase YUCCA10 n=1 Tax=Erigeron canadensis TaxID=72917 RepID=UPI001CB96BC3|nr:probable indole-3-pyruvate monooxygenase YUCCA10 [Erigeron canadensis]